MILSWFGTQAKDWILIVQQRGHSFGFASKAFATLRKQVFGRLAPTWEYSGILLQWREHKDY